MQIGQFVATPCTWSLKRVTGIDAGEGQRRTGMLLDYKMVYHMSKMCHKYLVHMECKKLTKNVLIGDFLLKH